jgi:hypothetical protein
MRIVGARLGVFMRMLRVGSAVAIVALADRGAQDDRRPEVGTRANATLPKRFK